MVSSASTCPCWSRTASVVVRTASQAVTAIAQTTMSSEEASIRKSSLRWTGSLPPGPVAPAAFTNCPGAARCLPECGR